MPCCTTFSGADKADVCSFIEALRLLRITTNLQSYTLLASKAYEIAT
jgi:hypothetical protein